MRYSVWNGSGYTYYEAPGSLRDGVFAAPPRIQSIRKLGVAPEEAAARLPAAAKVIGSGPYPMGTIATRNGNAVLGALDFDSGVVKTLTLLALGYAVYRLVGTR